MKPVTVSMWMNGILLITLFLLPEPAPSSISEGTRSHNLLTGQPAPSLFAPSRSDVPRLVTEGKETVDQSDVPQGWIEFPKDQFLAGVFVTAPTPSGGRIEFGISPDILEALAIRDEDYEIYQTFSKEHFTSVLEAEAAKTEAVEEDGGIGFFRMASVREEVEEFRRKWVQEMRNLWPVEVVDIIEYSHRYRFSQYELERHISLDHRADVYAIHVKFVREDGRRIRSGGGPFVLQSGNPGGGRLTLRRYLHIPAISEVVLPFLEEQGIDLNFTDLDR